LTASSSCLSPIFSPLAGAHPSSNVFGRLGTLGYPFVKRKAEAVIKEFGDKVKVAIEGNS
jgi:hypothetical protein